ncbi:organic solvent tolerance protein [Ruegeria marisrubri]|uniref:LPS-assembly protein LptD n=1 Tax=Ruegeria marisrubri TaxID=1685379 RepID=A0A0X3TZ13_9RHOB|nr:LPS assembly protein LptD [Ruegeria marisrubri]KUJ80958.1 organic solvent tolerance protein [Ruegeria marisrubri]
MRRTLTAIISCMAVLALPHSAQAQSPRPDAAEAEQQDQPALLVADRVFLTGDKTLVAEGNVVVFQGDARLEARKITYDRTSGRLSIEGPIRLDQGGASTILADAAELDDSLHNGLLTGARMVFDQQVQIAGTQMRRVSGRYTRLYKATATSCHVCENGKPPLWQIRAQKVTHDQLERQIYFENAQFRILDVPVFYFPVIRLPDPTLDRATGFLVPSLRTTSQLGTGLQVPYFFKLGDHKDLTLTPYFSPKTRTLGYRYRQAFRNGRITIEGAQTRDDLQPGEDRGYLFASGWFNLKNDFRFTFDLKTTSDDAYLVDYGLPDLDRLRSEIALTRIKRDAAFKTSFIHYRSLRDSENDEEIPSRVFDLNYEKRFFPNLLGGEVRLGFVSHAHERTSDEDIVGRDVARATFDAEWLRSWTFATGLRAEWQMGASADTFDTSDDSTFPDRVTRATPRAAFTLRYPMLRREGSGATQYIEPIAQIGWTHVSDTDVLNDESNYQEFDQGNLLSLSRFPAEDRREDGTTAVVGLNWSRFAPNGLQAFATIGQVFRDTADPDFNLTSGLQGTSSDLLLAGQIKTNDGIALTARGILNGDLDFSKAELRGSWRTDRGSIAGSYVWLAEDPTVDRTDAFSEIWFGGRYAINRNWTTTASARYDLEASSAINAGVGLTYRNECVTVNMSVRRRYTTTSSIEPSTDFGFTVALTGYAIEGAAKKYRRTCS